MFFWDFKDGSTLKDDFVIAIKEGANSYLRINIPEISTNNFIF